MPHLAYHVAHLDVYDPADAVGNIATLSLAAVVPLVVLVITRRRHPGVAAAP